MTREKDDFDLPDDDEIDLDDEIDFGDDGEDEPEDVEEEPKEKIEIVPTVDNEELTRIKQEHADLIAEREELRKARHDAEVMAFNTEQSSVKHAILRWNEDIKREKAALRDLAVSLEEAKTSQDMDAVRRLSHSIAEKNDNVDTLTKEINRYTPVLDRAPPEMKEDTKAVVTKEAKKDPAQEMLSKWYAENSWYDDPKYAAKKEKAETLYKELVAKKYNPAGLKFWTHIDNELEKFEKKSVVRRTPPAARPLRNNGGLPPVGNKQKADANTMKEVHKMLAKRDVTPDHPKYKELRKSYYKTQKRFEAEDRANNG